VLGAIAAAVLVGALPSGAAASVPCVRASAASAALSLSAARGAIRCELNVQRADSGLGALRPSARLSRAAQRHGADMVARGYFAHVSPAGTTIVERARAAGYLRGTRDWDLGENIGWIEGAAATGQGIVAAWMNSPEHRAIILSARFQEVGIGVAYGTPMGTAGATYVLDVGLRADAPDARGAARRT